MKFFNIYNLVYLNYLYDSNIDFLQNSLNFLMLYAECIKNIININTKILKVNMKINILNIEIYILYYYSFYIMEKHLLFLLSFICIYI